MFKNQVTLPIAVRNVLGVGPQDKINFKIVDGVVRVEKAEEIADDQVVSAYLKFLEKRHACKPPATICFAKGKSL